MFDSNSCIRMPKLVLCSGRDGAQDPGFCLLESRVRFVAYYDHYMTHSLDGCDHAWVYLSILTGWLCPYLGSRFLCALLWMVAPIPHISCTWDINCTYLRRFSGGSVFSYACSCKSISPLSLPRASCFRGHLLHSNLSPFVTVPVSPLPYIGGLISGLVRSDITWNHLHYIPLSVSFICPEDISCRIPIKRPIFALVRFHIVLLTPMGEIL